MCSYRAAVIGCGYRGRGHVQAYRLIPEAKVVACMSKSSERSQALANEFGLHAYTDITEMLAAEKPDVVHIATPPSVRLDPMRLVSDFGVPAATVEKPIAIGVRDWKDLCELSRSTSTKFAVSHQFRWHPDLERCREAIPNLGKLHLLVGTAGMSVANQGTHALHYAASLNGDRPVVSVLGAAAGWETEDRSHPGPKDTLGLLQFNNGVRMHWNVGPSAPRVGDPSTTWQHVRVAAYGEQGHVLWQEFGHWEILGPDGLKTGDFAGFDVWERINEEAQAAFQKEVIEWIEDKDRLPGTNLERSLHEWKVVMAVYASALNRERIELDSFEPDDDLLEKLHAS